MTRNCGPIGRALITTAVVFAAVVGRPAAQQDELVFEVASIKENTSDTNRVYMNVLPGGRFVATNVSLATLVAGAYGSDIPLPPNRVVLPAAWAGSGPYTTAPRFDIEAKAGREFKPGEVLGAVRHLLADRFKLAVHHEMREQPIYALVMDRADRRLGPRLKRSEVDCTDPTANRTPNPDGTATCGIRGRAGSATGRHTMTVLAGFFTNIVPDHRMVEDRTGLMGTYEFQIDWAPEVPPPADGSPAPPSDPNAATIFTAAREQLGVRLDAGRKAVDVLVVDRVERPTEN
jgi:uncharacterized protein (TIGR03435 family)